MTIKKINKEKKIKNFKKNFLLMTIFLATIKENVQKKIVFVIKKGGNAKNIAGVLKHVKLNSLDVYVLENVELLASAR